MTHNLSSGATLILRLFLPVVWLVFFGSFMAAGWLSGEAFIGPFPRDNFRIMTTLFVATGAVFFYLTVWRLHRVDADQDHLYVSDYFRTYRYGRDTVQELVLRHYGLFHLGVVHLKAPGKFGRKIWFLPSRRRLEGFVARESWPFRTA